MRGKSIQAAAPIGPARSLRPLAIATLLVSALLMAMPTTASAGYNVAGLIRIALAHSYGAYHGSNGHSQAARRSRDADADDASDPETPPRKQDIGIPSRRPDAGQEALRPTEGRMVTGRSHRDEPTDALMH
jgi:hypothetical protein